MESHVLYTDHGDGSAKFTLSFADDDHRFSVGKGFNGHAKVEYEETLSWRGKIQVSEPSEEIFAELMKSEEMSAFLDEYGYAGVRREHRA